MKTIQDVLQLMAQGASRAEVEAMMAKRNCNVTDAQIAMVREMLGTQPAAQGEVRS